jgi:hypothetical protein
LSHRLNATISSPPPFPENLAKIAEISLQMLEIRTKILVIHAKILEIYAKILGKRPVPPGFLA